MAAMRPPRLTPRAEYRLLQTERVSQSPSLHDKFPHLKSLTLELTHYDADGASRLSQVKYTLNLAHARSLFHVDCSNSECVRGDFDLSDEIANAVAHARAAVTGELRCRGWRNKTTIDRVPCRKMLRYTLTLAYAAPGK